MCGKFFGIGIIVFVLTFGLSIFISSIFVPNDLPSPASVPPVSPDPVENKNCVPVNQNLKYRTLENKESSIFPKKTESKAETSEKIKSAREDWEKPRSADERSESFDYSTKDSREVDDLLHRERCFESPERK